MQLSSWHEKRNTMKAFTLLAIGLIAIHCAGEEGAEPEMPWEIGGVGGAYLLAEPGELEVEVFKRDLNLRDRGMDVRAMLVGPDRAVLDEAEIPHAGGAAGDPPGRVQRVVLRTQVDRPGVYAMMITAAGDRHGLNIGWGMRANAAAYVVETSRGHRDERHKEPIVLLDRARPADVAFLPRPGEFTIEVEGLPPGVEALTLYDETGSEVARIPAESAQRTAIRDYLRVSAPGEPEGSVQYTVSADEARGAEPWRLHFPKGKAFVSIDGVTRWGGGDRYADHAVWTPEPASWFPLLEHRWLITPYQRSIWAEPQAQGEITFLVHNNAPDARTMSLALEFPEEEWPAALSDQTVTLDADEAQEVTVAYTAPGDGETRVCHVRAVPEAHAQVTTYATLTVRGGEAPPANPLDMPLVLEPYAHENRQFGYVPEYPVDNQVYFDLENRPYVVNGRTLHRKADGAWTQTDLDEAVVRRQPDFEPDGRWSAVSTKVAFDADNDVYLLARAGAAVALLRSEDGGETFTANLIPGREDEPRSWDFEQFSGHNVPQGAPPVVRFTRTYVDDADTPTGRRDPRVRWRRVNDLDLFVGEKTDGGGLAFQEPMTLSDRSLGVSMHSGIPASVVSRDSKVHVVWGEATDPEASRDEIPGVPAYVATYDRDSNELGEPEFMSYGPPPNDVHNTPSVTMDSEGYLHVVVGTHGRPFQYLQSLEPNNAYGGWTEPIRTSEDELRQTYVGLVCGADDALHLVFRQWRSGEDHLDGALWAALAYQRKLPGEEWSEAKTLVRPPLSEYSIYYHRLTIDREGALFVSYDYWSTMWFYRNDQRGPVAAASGRPGRGWGRAVLTSADGGDAWGLW